MSGGGGTEPAPDRRETCLTFLAIERLYKLEGKNPRPSYWRDLAREHGATEAQIAAVDGYTKRQCRKVAGISQPRPIRSGIKRSVRAGRVALAGGLRRLADFVGPW